MKILDYIKMSLKNLMRKKIRTGLTMLSVAIGTFAIVIMVSLGIGINEAFEKQIMEMGSLTTIDVSQYNYPDSMEEYMPVKPTAITDDSIAVLAKIPHVRGVTPVMNQGITIKTKRYETYADLQAIDFDMLEYFDYPEIEKGPAAEPGYDLKKGIIAGGDAMWFYNPKSWDYEQPEVDLFKDKLTFWIEKYEDDEAKEYEIDTKIIGQFPVTNGETDWNNYIDIDELKKILKDNQEALTSDEKKNLKNLEYDRAMVSVDNINNVEAVQEAIEAYGYGTSSLGDMLKPMQETSKTLQLVLGGIGGISLFIAAIGIANTMIMSTYERTREIGIMKVLGCKGNDIRKLFLLEAAVIGLLGGLVGLILSYTCSYFVNKYGAQFMSGFIGTGEEAAISVIPIWLALFSLVFSFLIGLISGYFPARRATKIKALEALKTE